MNKFSFFIGLLLLSGCATVKGGYPASTYFTFNDFDVLKNSVVSDFYDAEIVINIFYERNNVRWVMSCNTPLTDFNEIITREYVTRSSNNLLYYYNGTDIKVFFNLICDLQKEGFVSVKNINYCQ